MRPLMRSRERGSSLLLVIVVSAIALAIIMMTLTEQQVAVKYAGMSARQLQVQYAAEAGLSYICDQVGHPTLAYTGPQIASITTVIPGPNGYSGGTNLWLNAVRDTTAPAPNNNWKPMFDPTTTIAVPKPTFWIRGAPPGNLAKNVATPDIPVYCWLQDSGGPGNDYRIAAYAEYPQKRGELGPTPDDRLQMVCDLRESVGFSTYMFCNFANVPLNLGAMNVSGSIHSNGTINFTSTTATGGMTILNNGNITARSTMTNNNPSYRQVNGGNITPNAPAITIPANSQVTNLTTTAQQSAAPPASVPAASGANFYNFVKGASGGAPWQTLTGATVNLDITLRQPSPPAGPYVMDIVATGSGGGSTTYTNVALPTAGVLYTDGNVTVRSADGNYMGNMTVVSGAGNVTIDSSIQYKDTSGNNSQVLADAAAYAGGTTTVRTPAANNSSWFNAASATPPGEGLAYVANPAYTGNSSLGLLAMNNVYVSNLAGTTGVGVNQGNLFLTVDTYAQTGSGLDAYALNAPSATATGGLNPGAAASKYNLAVSGSLVGNQTVKRHALGSTGGPDYGFPKSGGYSFDNKTANAPPPGWLANQSPAFGATYKVSVYNSLFPGRWMQRLTSATYNNGPAAHVLSLYNGFGGT